MAESWASPADVTARAEGETLSDFELQISNCKSKANPDCRQISYSSLLQFEICSSKSVNELLRHAVERPEAPDQIDRMDADDFVMREAFREDAQGLSVLNVVERRD